MAVETATAAAIPEQTNRPDVRRQRWLVLATLFVVMLFLIGSTAMTVPIFFMPLVKQYGWSHARTSLMATVFVLLLGGAAPIAGWLLDRIQARVVMGTGAAMIAVGLLWASRTHSFWGMLGAWTLMGAGGAASTVVPCAVVAANWFADNRGLAIGATLSGSGTGGIILPPMTDYLIRNYSIATAYFVLAVPIIVIVLPMILLLIRTRPAGAVKASVAEEVANLPGLELRPALRTAPFWLLGLIQLTSSVGLAAAFYHTVPYLIHMGYSPAHAALLQGAITAVGVPVNPFIGIIVDRFTARRVLPFALITMAVSLLLLIGAGRPQGWLLYLVIFVIAFGMTAGITSSVVPVATVETLGLRRFGSISGLIGLAATFGLSGGTVLVGRIFDITSSYSVASEMGAASTIVGALAAFLVKPAEGVGAIPKTAMPHGH
ncbi:MAG TPA: MFS transporter [Candidatus Binataceae bacterium]|nr:MFS transporter [Candidatus Binataceae bacterium]